MVWRRGIDGGVRRAWPNASASAISVAGDPLLPSFATLVGSPGGVAVGLLGGIAISQDYGQSWLRQPLPATGLVLCLATTAEPGSLVVATATEVHRRTDSGATWQTHPYTGPPPRMLAVSPADDAVVLLAAEDGLVCRSTDRGASFKAVTHAETGGLPGGASMVRFDRSQPQHAYAAIVDGARQGRLLLSRDTGLTWHVIARGSIRDFATSAHAGRIVVAAGHEGVFLRRGPPLWPLPDRWESIGDGVGMPTTAGLLYGSYGIEPIGMLGTVSNLAGWLGLLAVPLASVAIVAAAGVSLVRERLLVVSAVLAAMAPCLAMAISHPAPLVLAPPATSLSSLIALGTPMRWSMIGWLALPVAPLGAGVLALQVPIAGLWLAALALPFAIGALGLAVHQPRLGKALMLTLLGVLNVLQWGALISAAQALRTWAG